MIFTGDNADSTFVGVNMSGRYIQVGRVKGELIEQQETRKINNREVEDVIDRLPPSLPSLHPGPAPRGYLLPGGRAQPLQRDDRGALCEIREGRLPRRPRQGAGLLRAGVRL